MYVWRRLPEHVVSQLGGFLRVRWGFPRGCLKAIAQQRSYSLDSDTSTKQHNTPRLTIPRGHLFINSLFYCRVAYENISSYYFTSQLFQSSSQPHAEPRGPLHRICSIKSCFLKYISFSLQLSVTGLLVLCFVRRGNRIGYLVSSICEFLSRFLGWNRDPHPILVC